MTQETTTVACAPWESIQKAKRREQTVQQRPFVSFPIDPTAIPRSGVAARKGQSVEDRLQTFPCCQTENGTKFEVKARAVQSNRSHTQYLTALCMSRLFGSSSDSNSIQDDTRFSFR